MKTLAEIIQAIESLSEPEQFEVFRWIENRRDAIEKAADDDFAVSRQSDKKPVIPGNEI